MSEMPDLRWIVGIRVVHPEFGPGKLVALSHIKEALHKATVAFDNGRRETFDIDGSGLTRE
jgi:hypothetical protein